VPPVPPHALTASAVSPNIPMILLRMS
jgi:hypothetical protein